MRTKNLFSLFKFKVNKQDVNVKCFQNTQKKIKSNNYTKNTPKMTKLCG
jgi:hypothetical protein